MNISSSTPPTSPSPTFRSKNNFIIDFLDHNGMRPIIALAVIAGAVWITLNSSEICVIRDNSTQAPAPSGTQAPIVIRDNPVCSKYFEMAALVLGGLIGLAEPGIRRREATPERSNSEEDASP